MDKQPVIKEFKKCRNDKARWEWAIRYKEMLVISCDNDSTQAFFRQEYQDSYEDDNIECTTFDFETWLGNDDGVFELLEAIGFVAIGPGDPL